MYVRLFVCVHPSIGRARGISARVPPVGWLAGACWFAVHPPGSMGFLSTSRGVPARESFPSPSNPTPALSYITYC